MISSYIENELEKMLIFYGFIQFLGYRTSIFLYIPSKEKRWKT